MTNDEPSGLPDVDFLRTVAKEFAESGSVKVAAGVAKTAEALRLASLQLDAIAEALDLPKEAWRIAGCNVLEHQVRDLLRNYIALRDKTDDPLPPDDVLLQRAEDMRHALEMDRQASLSETALTKEMIDAGAQILLQRFGGLGAFLVPGHYEEDIAKEIYDAMIAANRHREAE